MFDARFSFLQTQKFSTFKDLVQFLCLHGSCKVVIFKYVFCWLSFRAKFDCMLFNLLYPVFIVGFHCKGCELKRERECEDSSN